jgi:hypothetical protein
MGGQVNVTDGQYVYMRGHVTEDNSPLNDYTLMPTHMRSLFATRELQQWDKFSGFSFLKGCEVMQIPTRTPKASLSDDNPFGRGKRATLLFDVVADPGQTNPLDDPDIESRMIRLMLVEMARNECPDEQYERLGLPKPNRIGDGHADEMIQLPPDQSIRAACILQTSEGQEFKNHAGNGFPKMPFQKIGWEAEKTVTGISFPDNLRLRPGYAFSQRETPPTKS